MGARAVPFVDAGLFDAVGCRMTEKRKGKSLRFALSAALLYAGALACCSLFACMSADARGRGGAFIPRSAARGGAEHPPVPLSSLKDPSLADASTFENVKPDCIDTACVACHVNRGLNLALPPVRTPDGKPGPAYYLGGESGTVFNSTTKAFEQPSPAIEKAGLTSRFLAGEAIFEGNFVGLRACRATRDTAGGGERAILGRSTETDTSPRCIGRTEALSKDTPKCSTYLPWPRTNRTPKT